MFALAFLPLAGDHGHDSALDDLDLLRAACPDITTLKLLLPSDRANVVLRNSSVFTELLDLIDTRLEAFPSLREVRIDVKLLGWKPDEDSENGAEDPEDDELEDPRDDRWKTHKDSLRQLCSRGWAVNIKEIWVSDDGRVEFDNEDDCNEYNNDQYRLELEWEEEQESEREEEWARERQWEAYRMDYADDGGPA